MNRQDLEQYEGRTVTVWLRYPETSRGKRTKMVDAKVSGELRLIGTKGGICVGYNCTTLAAYVKDVKVGEW